MTLEFDNAPAPEGIKSAMSVVVKNRDFDIDRSSSLAAHALKKLGIPLKQGESHWEIDSDTTSLMLHLANQDQSKMVTISIQAFPHTQTPDEVSIQVINAKKPLDEVTTLGAEYRVEINRDTNRVVYGSEAIKTVTVYNKESSGSVQRCIHRADNVPEMLWGTADMTFLYEHSHGLKATMNEVRHSPAIADANNKLVFATFNNATFDEQDLFDAPDSFAALTAIAGDVSEFKSIPTELLN